MTVFLTIHAPKYSDFRGRGRSFLRLRAPELHPSKYYFSITIFPLKVRRELLYELAYEETLFDPR